MSSKYQYKVGNIVRYLKDQEYVDVIVKRFLLNGNPYYICKEDNDSICEDLIFERVKMRTSKAH